MNESSQQKAVAIMPYIGVVGRDDKGRIDRVYCPSTTRFDGGKRGAPRFACVCLSRDGDAVSMTCTHFQTLAPDEAGEPCPAPAAGRLCFHARAALLAVAAEAHCSLEVHLGEEYARRAIDGNDGRGRCLTVTIGTATVYAALLPSAKRPAKPAEQAEQPPAEPVKAKPAKQEPERCPRCRINYLRSQDEADAGLCTPCMLPPAKPAPVDLFGQPAAGGRRRK